MSKLRDKRIRQAKTTLAWLYENLSQVFRPDADIRPLKVGIKQELMSLELPFGKHRVRRALSLYASRTQYRRKLVAGAFRIDLEGNICGAVSEEEAWDEKQGAWKRDRYAGTHTSETK